VTANPRQSDLSRRSQAKAEAITELGLSRRSPAEAEAVVDDLREIVALVEKEEDVEK
jgi:plasmid stabilization system protein ParE